MRMAKRSRETWGKNLGRKLSAWRRVGKVLGSIWGYLESQGSGMGIPRAGVELGATTASLGDGFNTQTPRISVFPSVK